MKLSRSGFFLALLPLVAAASSVDKGKAFGNPAAPITIELFSDFQCPACRALHTELLPSIMRDFVIPGKAYLVYKEFPLPMHNHSREAAAYACAAARVGKYEQVADVLFQNQPTWESDGKVFETVSSVLTPAEQKRVQALAKDPAVLAEVQDDVQEGQVKRVSQTPTMIIMAHGKEYPIAGGLNYNLLRGFLDGLAK
jgi:protein-disulfide isomerase